MPEETFEGFPVSESDLIFREVISVTNTGREIHNMMNGGSYGNFTNWSQGVRNFYNSVELLRSLTSRHQDREFVYKLKKLRMRYVKKWLDYKLKETDGDLLVEFSNRMTLNYSESKMSLILRLLDSKGVFSDTKMHALPKGVDEYNTDDLSNE